MGIRDKKNFTTLPKVPDVLVS